MSIEEVQRVDDQWMAAWNAHDVDAFVELLADDFVWTDVMMPEPMRTKDQARQYVAGWFTAFPDEKAVQTNRIATDDAVAAELEWHGTNSGPMVVGGKEVPPTGKSVNGRGAYLARVRNGKLAEISTYPDISGMMMQLGFMPEM